MNVYTSTALKRYNNIIICNIIAALLFSLCCSLWVQDLILLFTDMTPGPSVVLASKHRGYVELQRTVNFKNELFLERDVK